MRVEHNPEFYGPWSVTNCRRCGFQQVHQCTSDLTRDRRSWLRRLVTNWWENGWRIEVRHGEQHPVGYGVSWQEIHRMVVTMHPIPFNVVMRLGYDAFMWAHMGGWREFPTIRDQVNHEVAKRIQAANAAELADNPRGSCPDCHADLGEFYSNRIVWRRNG